MSDPGLWRALLAELVGTFALVFFGVGAIVVDARYGGIGHGGVAAAFGLAVAAAIYSLGHISGAHINPAVTAAFAVGRHFPWTRTVGYWGAQLAGAIAGAAVIAGSVGTEADLGSTVPSGSDAQSFVWEVVLTAVLMLVVTAVATDTRAVGQAAALAIGGTVALDALVGGPISGASMNPARSLGPALVSGTFESLWIYLTAPFIGAIIGLAIYELLRGERPGRPGGQPSSARNSASASGTTR